VLAHVLELRGQRRGPLLPARHRLDRLGSFLRERDAVLRHNGPQPRDLLCASLLLGNEVRNSVVRGGLRRHQRGVVVVQGREGGRSHRHGGVGGRSAGTHPVELLLRDGRLHLDLRLVLLRRRQPLRHLRQRGVRGLLRAGGVLQRLVGPVQLLALLHEVRAQGREPQGDRGLQRLALRLRQFATDKLPGVGER